MAASCLGKRDDVVETVITGERIFAKQLAESSHCRSKAQIIIDLADIAHRKIGRVIKRLVVSSGSLYLIFRKAYSREGGCEACFGPFDAPAAER